MPFITELKTQLYELLSRPNSISAEYITVKQHYPTANLLLWLKSQPAHIKIYWHDKDNVVETAMLGLCHQITDLSDKSRIREANYFGGVSFGAAKAQQQQAQNTDLPASLFVLPRLELRQTDNTCELICHIDNRNNQLNKEVAACLTLIDQLKPLASFDQINTKNPILNRIDIPNKQQWYQLFNKVTNEIQNKTLSKVVLSRQSTLSFSNNIDPWQLLYQWGNQNNNCYQFGFQFEDNITFIGCSPERLYLRTGSRLITEALAGTAKRGSTEKEDIELAESLLNSPKLLRENTVVREDILSRLGKLSLDLGLDDATILKLKRIQHLKQRIHAFLHENVTDSRLIQELHPTPAVGGSPRRKSLTFLHHNEPYNRGWYSGAFGFFSDQESEFSVAIRSALVVKNSINLYSGAGIVQGSVADQEWQELDDKIGTVLTLLT